MLGNNKVPIGTVQRILGHENRLTTEIYLHLIGDGKRAAVGYLDQSLGELSHTDSHTKQKSFQPES